MKSGTPHHSHGNRAGLSLLEVLIATAIFMASLTAIMHIFGLGRQAELLTQLETEALLRCESTLGELVSGLRPLTSLSGQAFEDEAEGWIYGVDVQTQSEGLLLVTVQVDHVLNNGDVNASYTLVRMMRDPQLFLDAALAAESD